jgi:hypothetical protein
MSAIARQSRPNSTFDQGALMEPETFRGIERLVVCFGGIVFGYLGFRLFVFGAEKGQASLKTETKLFRVVFSGTAPGLFFMLVGGAILITALLVGGTNREEKKADGSEQHLEMRK